jgi:long-chain acyl-CoA synthetase
MQSSTATRAAVQATSVADAFRRTVREHPDQVAFRTADDSICLTWAQARERVDAIAGGLHELGVGPGDTVALLLSNRPEFHLADLGAMTLRAVPFSIYNTYAPEQIAYVIGDAGARVAICEQALLGPLLEARRELPDLEHVIVVDGDPPAGGLTLAELERRGEGFDGDAAAARVQRDDVLTLIYTSGTTGPPKGVQLVHRNLLAGVASVQELIQLEPGARVISWLPAAHVAERNAHHYVPIVFAGTVTTCDNPREIIRFLPQVRPNWFFAVPRIWEKLKAGLESMLAAQPAEQRRAGEAALAAAVEKVRREQRGEDVPKELAEQVARADAEMFSHLRAMLGLDEAVTVNVGAAPTPPEVLEFFHAIGIELAELWGMSETCGMGAVNPPGKVRIGTVGPPVPGAEMKLAEDGELLVRGDFVMTGYRNMAAQTAEALDDEGWLHTGDIGEFDSEGYLRIVDRKKELIISSAGKNMSPAHIESCLKGAGPLIGQAAVIGDRRAYNTALIVLDADGAPAWAREHGIEDGGLADLAPREDVRAAVQAEVDAANTRLARVEQIKKFHLVAGDWLPGGDELTPTMKLKRNPIAAKYAGAIEAMYAG